ncbi:hypothetical protein EYF88_12460 [Paracoccus sediminis]|uniref:Uncharacterized protein n=1 Tax=Paracoccus sediminis TaxID=1214787 RepID=A0A238X078_9RHOB|nr:hypothetical protein [Paracoccus sediminis]TBN49376.1 hypothetical protein EYF88_12460 [Paracoccus sediminis]SNR52031.1 hypothetical protein SAMN06265378_1073 [Paracoccus sediminis]
MIPDAYELKRILRTQRARFWSSDLLAAAEFAPIYFFDDQAAFDSDVVDQAMTRVFSGPIRLPNPAVIFELREQRSAPSGLIVCARQKGDIVEAAFLMRRRAPCGWTDCLVRVWLHPDGMAEIEGNPTECEDQTIRGHGEVAAGIVWRAMTILGSAPGIRDQKLSLAKRSRMAREGVRGWVWHQVAIDPARLRAAIPPQGGSHASPRWHLRRGHWRRLADGRRVFVRQCEVGDPTRGGVVKDYTVEIPGHE